ncbi:MAG: type VI secretion system tube protein Hcp [Nitrosopumilus sp.]|nr:type VI secretion system tube protein Hcp [Nitrosopumilus sp.]
MTSKTIIAGIVALAFVASTIMTGTMVYAEHKPGHQTNSGGLGELQKQVEENTGHVTVLKGQADSFDTEILSMDLRVSSLEESQTSVDSFFDIFTELYSSPDSFFDIFVDASGQRIDSFFDVFTEISVHNADVERIDTEMLSLDLRLNDQQEQIDGIISNPPSESASTTAYIKFDGVDGEATDKDHQAWSDLLSFDQGLHQPGGSQTGSTRTRGDVILDDVVVVKELDKASPKIAESVALGKVYPKVEIELTKTYGDAGRLTYYAYELTNVLVTSYNISGSGQSEDVPSENFSLNFEEIKVTYTERDSDGKSKGNVEYSWKVEEGES